MTTALGHTVGVLATIIQTGKLAQVVAYSLVAGVGVTAVFALGVSSAAGLMDAVREHRLSAVVGWAALGTMCGLITIGVIVLGIVVMSTK